MAQPKKKTLVDGIAAVVGSEVVLISDIEVQYDAAQRQNYGVELDECMVFGEMLLQKLMLHQAEIDSVMVDDSEVDMNLDRRFAQLEQQLGGQRAVERFYEKSYVEMKEEMRSLMKNQLIAERMRGQIVQDIDVTPGEVQSFFDGIPTDSLPLINTEVEVAQIVKFPEISREAEEEAIKKLKDLKSRIESGMSFRSMAVLYSEDPGSSKEGGKYTGIKRGQFVKEFEAVAFNLKRGEISDPFKTEYGYHIVQLIEKKGQELDLQHILIKPKFTQEDLAEAKNFLDSLRVSITSGAMSFEEAAREFSEDDGTKFNGGILVNLNTGDTKWEVSMLDRQLFAAINVLKEGEISKPQFMRTQDQKEGFRLVLLRKRTEPHKANMHDDYQFIKVRAQQTKQQKALEDWVENKIDETYIKISPNLFDCELQAIWQKMVK